MEALWAIAAGLPVLVPRRTAMAEFLKYCFGNHAEYFLYEPNIDDLSDQICKMLNRTEAIGVTRQLKDKFQSHTDINQSQENFNSCLSEIPQPNTLPGTAVSPPHRQSTDDGIGSLEDTSSQQSLSPQPVSPESPIFPNVASTSQVQTAPVIARKRPLMPTVLCEADLDIVEKRLKMETAQLMERERQQLELQKEKNKQHLDHQKEKDKQQFNIQKEKCYWLKLRNFMSLRNRKSWLEIAQI
ncbi:uncharacterized protein [Ptychodera flava]|uniref:uncharacterized protein isoform X2 n=1 Tax=Ptychodera flava TaxID=63121 RepID=UPI003969DB9F